LNIDALAADAAVPSSVHARRVQFGVVVVETINPTPVVMSTSAFRRTFASAPSVGKVRAKFEIVATYSIELV